MSDRCPGCGRVGLPLLHDPDDGSLRCQECWDKEEARVVAGGETCDGCGRGSASGVEVRNNPVTGEALCYHCRLAAQEAEMQEESKVVRMEGVNTAVPNAQHNPSDRLEDIVPAPGYLVLLRPWEPGKDGEMLHGKIVVPAGAEDTTKREYPSNCSKVVAAGPGCKTPVGWYVFFAQRAEAEKAWAMKPQPLVFERTDKLPTLWVLHESYVLARTPPRA